MKKSKEIQRNPTNPKKSIKKDGCGGQCGYIFDEGDALQLSENVVGDRSGGGRVVALGFAAQRGRHAGARDHTRRPHRQFVLCHCFTIPFSVSFSHFQSFSVINTK